MKYRTIFVLLLFYSLLFSQKHIIILHTNNLNSTLENCICPDHPFGSIEKIKPIVDEIRKNEKNVLLLDAGDVLSPFGDKKKDITMLEALPHLKYDIMTPGDQDFLNGIDFFKSYFLNKHFPVISANLSINAPPYVIKKMGNFKIGVVGITSEKAFNFFPEDKRGQISVADVDKGMEKVLNELKGKTDMLVLLSHSGLDEDKKLAVKFPSVDLIIGGHSQNALKEGLKAGNTMIVQAGSDGYYLGRVDIVLNNSNKISQIKASLIPIGIELKNDPLIVNIIKKYDYTFIHKAVTAQKLKTPVDKQYFIGDAQNCESCHLKQYKAWQQSPHARSWQSLAEDKKTKSLKCLSCHVSGFGREEGFINENITANMKNVSCVDCHYTSPEHMKKKSRDTVKKISQETCTVCHDKENDADFNFEKALLRVKH